MTKLTPKFNIDFLIKSHNKNSSHKAEILLGELCACFYCEQRFSPHGITEWIEEPNGGETAICPKCRIDSVLSS